MMKRREFITLLGGASAAWPLAVRAQQSSRMPSIGVLLAEDDQGMQERLAGLRQGLDRLGWSDGRNIRMVYRFCEGKPDRFQPLAKELVAMQPNLIVAQSPLVVAAVRQETSVIPIVFVDVSDPIGPGFVDSLARPGGSITGLLTFEAGIVGKWLAMVKEITPGLTRVALVGNPKTTAFGYFLRAARDAASSLGVEIMPQQVETASDIERVVETVGHISDSVRRVVSCLIAPISFSFIGKRRLISTVSFAAPSPQTFQYRRRQSLKRLST